MVKQQRKPPRPVTLADLAAAAGVSLKTASLAMHAHPSVASDTAHRVQQTAVRLRYRSKAEPRNVLGVVVPHIGHRVYTNLIRYLRDFAASYRFQVMIMDTSGDAEWEKRSVEELRWRRTDGIILIASRLPLADIQAISQLICPVVTINVPIRDGKYTFGSVNIDHEAAAFMATRHLIDRKHQAIAYLAGRAPSWSDQERRAGYKRALQENSLGYQDTLVIESSSQLVPPGPSYESGYDQCKRLLSRGGEVDGIVAYDDVTAIGALQFLHEKKIEVPAKISIIGIDNLQLCDYVWPRLTSVGVEWQSMAWLAIDVLFQLIQRDPDLRKPAVLGHTLDPLMFMRESVRDVPVRE